MKSISNRQNGDHSSFSKAWQQTFGSSMILPRANGWLVLAVTVTALFGAGVAMADWRVSDQEVRRNTEKIRDIIGTNGTVNGKLDDLNFKLGLRHEQPGEIREMIAEPSGDEKLDAAAPLKTAVPMDKLCTASIPTGLAKEQEQLCQQLVQTELARYRFSMRMFERAKENYDELKKIEERRRQLSENDFANIQYNTNELLALTALMDNDRDRYQTYMAAYSARIDHINHASSALTRNAIHGTRAPISLKFW